MKIINGLNYEKSKHSFRMAIVCVNSTGVVLLHTEIQCRNNRTVASNIATVEADSDVRRIV